MSDTDRRSFLVAAGLGLGSAALWGCRSAPAEAQAYYPYTLTDAQWRKKLSPFAYQVLRHADTERPFSSPLNDEHRVGTFHCKGCGQAAYSSKTKFDSGTGWPSFWAPLPRAVATKPDTTMFMERTEVHCTRCGSHLGHVFDDGPKPTGKRYCMDGVALTFTPGAAA